MSSRVKFFSNKLQKEIEGTRISETKYTVNIKLDDGKIIQKKQRQVIGV